MSDAVLFVIIFVGFFVLRAVAATVFFVYMLPDDGRCPNCDEETIRIQSRAWELGMPWLRLSWCHACGWEGMLRHTRRPAIPPSPGFQSRRGHEAPRP